jgi:cell division septum initiation protein DivIVA
MQEELEKLREHNAELQAKLQAATGQSDPSDDAASSVFTSSTDQSGGSGGWTGGGKVVTQSGLEASSSLSAKAKVEEQAVHVPTTSAVDETQ